MRVIELAGFSLQQIQEIALHAILEQLSVQAFFDRVYAITKLPMICFDTSFQHIAHAFKLPFYLDAWVDICVNDRAGADQISRYNYLSYQEDIVTAGKSIVVRPTRTPDHPSVDCAVTYQGELLAYCGTVIEDHDPACVLALNDLVSRTIPRLLIPEMLKKNNLAPLIVKDNLTEKEAALLNRQLPNPYFFAVLSPVDCGLSTMQYIRHHIEDSVEHAVSTIAGNKDVYMLFSNASTDTFILTLMESIEQLGRRYSFQTAFSCSFFDASEIPARRRQALLTMQIGRHFFPEQRQYYLRFLYPEVIAYYAARTVSPELLLTPELKKLSAALPEKSEQLFLDLFHYLFYDGNFRRAADTIGVHKNTLIYRISQICDLSGLDLSSIRSRNRQLLSLYLWLLNHNLLPEVIHE